ncbi:acyltransferase [Frondihabitans sucicola]|uniref:Acyltransferase n=2 Tax=Frondihabitans sucicola TaxID=1268041 RepID=A0ABN6XYA5_9MICO|nr:acyltransferase [Frondihabitans sucicola]
MLALIVIVSHSWPIGGYGDDPQLGDQNLGAWAVAGFFAISGYLISASRQNSATVTDFAVKRLLRIVPGFVAVLLVTAVAIAPVSSAMTGIPYDWASGFGYVIHNVGLVITQPSIAGTLTDVPLPGRWNGALWTIAYEALCYLVIGVLVSIVPRRFLGRTLIVLGLLGTAATTTHVVFDLASDGHFAIRGVRLLTFFFAGAVLHVYQKRVPLHAGLALAAAACLAASMFLGIFQIVAGIPVAYLLMYLAVRLPLARIGSRNDVSYGLYIYGFPVQQLVATALIATPVPLPVYLAVVLVITVPCAWASWLLVERPAMRWGRGLLGRRNRTPSLVEAAR